MKLQYLRAKNVLSFGEEGVELEFGQFNIIAGPNDSGKTNLFRVLSLIEETFDHGKPSLNRIHFQGDIDRSLRLEVGVELDDMEIELLSTLIICLEMARVKTPEDIYQGITEIKFWESVLKKYGNAILTKSFKRLSFLLIKDELNTSELKMVLVLSNGLKSIFMDRNSHLSETSEDVGSYQRLSLTRLILDAFNSKYGELNETEINALLQNEGILAKECPSLVELLIGKLEGKAVNVIELRGQDLNQLRNDLRGEPFAAKLSNLFQYRNIEPQNLNLLNILHQMYKTSFVRMHELRISPPSLNSSSSSQDLELKNILGSYLAHRLFWLMNSGARSDRERYNKIKNEFKCLTGSEFDVAIRTRDVSEISEGSFGVLLEHKLQPIYPGMTQFVPLGFEKGNKTRLVNEAYIQVIKNNYPVAIEQTASGLYEILFLLTTIIGESLKVLLLDEPELHLHPTMQKRILNLLSESKDQNKNQIILITHSPYLISEAYKDTTWRFTKTDTCTKIHNLGRTLSELEINEQQELSVKLSSADIRSLLFSRGVIFVEGLSDKIVLEYTDGYLSMKNEGANIYESEWSVIDIGGKRSLHQFMTLGRMLGVPSAAIIDYDGLMHRDSRITINGHKIKTSSIIYALWRTGILKNELIKKLLLFEISESEWYDQSLLKDLKPLIIDHGVYVFSTDLEGVMQSPKTKKTKKPLKALERIIELINMDSIPPEFIEMCEFLRKFTLQ